jgi:hypothetical protein
MTFSSELGFFEVNLDFFFNKYTLKNSSIMEFDWLPVWQEDPSPLYLPLGDQFKQTNKMMKQLERIQHMERNQPRYKTLDIRDSDLELNPRGKFWKTMIGKQFQRGEYDMWRNDYRRDVKEGKKIKLSYAIEEQVSKMKQLEQQLQVQQNVRIRLERELLERIAEQQAKEVQLEQQLEFERRVRDDLERKFQALDN